MRPFFFVATALLLGCSGVEQGRTELEVPSRADFPAVAEALGPSCATLDCHGQIGRNFRFYWSRGLRLDPSAHPGEGETTDQEYDQTFRSLIALEPYKLDAVRKGTVKPESLTLVRKARGTEAHKGGALIVAGSDADVCLLSWLVGKSFSADVCKKATPK